MYPVSDLYKTAVQENARSFTWSGNITTATGKNYPFVNKDIVKGSGYITRQCSGTSEIELGSVYSAELGISLFSDVDRYSLEDAQIALDFHMALPDGNVEDIPMGIFYVAEANRKIRTLELKAYDGIRIGGTKWLITFLLKSFWPQQKIWPSSATTLATMMAPIP